MNFLTVIVPTIDRPTLKHTIASIEAQTVPVDLIVEHDRARSGCGPTLNRMLEKVQTPWVAGLADDDEFEPTFAERLLEQDLPNLAMVIFQMRITAGDIFPVVTEVDELCLGNVGSSFAMKTEVAREIGYMDVPHETTGRAEDWEMIDAVRSRGLPIKVVPEIQVLVRPLR